MRSLLLILMIALLPLRMWAAEGMSTQMAVASAGMPSMAGTGTADMPADCPFMAASAQEGESGDAEPAAAACASCQLCGAVAALAIFDSAPAVSPRILAPPVADAFRSALPLRGDKPPIS
ncbi:MAG: hypothetical protein EOO25_17920 [Comamonadaceae bacterium]|nr:MAG: hypothetical protein EOO25_17920 [Comamonadaceae bacterium]